LGVVKGDVNMYMYTCRSLGISVGGASGMRGQYVCVSMGGQFVYMYVYMYVYIQIYGKYSFICLQMSSVVNSLYFVRCLHWGEWKKGGYIYNVM